MTRVPDYSRSAYPAAWLAAACGFLYSVSFVLVARAAPGAGGFLSALFLLLGAAFSATALLGLYDRLRTAAGTYALWALVFALGGALAAALHAGTDLANVFHHSNLVADPNQADPRGLGTFGLAGVALLGFAYLMGRDATFPRGLVLLGYLSGGLLVLVYLARLIILTPTNPLVLGPAGIEGFIVNPLWYAWLGFALRARE